VGNRRDLLVSVPGSGTVDRESSATLGVLVAAVTQLDGLSSALEQVSPQPDWRAQQWMISTTPFRMLLTGWRRRTAELAGLSLDDEPDALRQEFEFNDAHLAVERGLREIDACLQILQCADVSTAERIKQAAVFARIRSELLAALQAIRKLIAQRVTAETAGYLKTPQGRQASHRPEDTRR
jgi:hypothetical protein